MLYSWEHAWNRRDVTLKDSVIEEMKKKMKWHSKAIYFHHLMHFRKTELSVRGKNGEKNIVILLQELIGWWKVAVEWSQSWIQTFEVDCEGNYQFSENLWLEAKGQATKRISVCFLLDKLTEELSTIWPGTWFEFTLTERTIHGYFWCQIKYGISFIIFILKLNRTWCQFLINLRAHQLFICCWTSLTAEGSVTLRCRAPDAISSLSATIIVLWENRDHGGRRNHHYRE